MIGCPSKMDVPASANDALLFFEDGGHAGIKVRANNNKVWVADVEKRDLAHMSGLRRNMIITSINTIPVYTATDVTNILFTVRNYRGCAVVHCEKTTDGKMNHYILKYWKKIWNRMVRRVTINPQSEL